MAFRRSCLIFNCRREFSIYLSIIDFSLDFPISTAKILDSIVKANREDFERQRERRKTKDLAESLAEFLSVTAVAVVD